MLISLIYVSRSLIPRSEQHDEIEAIVTGSLERNARLGVRGALIFTELHFAHLLEGPEAAVDELMRSMSRDLRHDSVTVIERAPIEDYRFADWSLAYWGCASYMDQKISAVLERQDPATLKSDTRLLYTLIRLLARESHEQNAPIGRPSPE